MGQSFPAGFPWDAHTRGQVGHREMAVLSENLLSESRALSFPAL